MLASVVVALLLTAGCAFFNTFYNARKAYRTAEDLPRLPDGSVNRTAFTAYDKVIEKCESLIANYPDSKWVDDAVLLMGKAYYRKTEYNDAITKFDEFQANFPESDLIDEAQLYLAKSYVAKNDAGRAVPVLQTLIERSPKGKFADETLFLLGTNMVKIDQEAGALEYLEILASTYPNSSFRVEADLEIANLYLERGDAEKSIAVFRKLAGIKLSSENELRYLTKLSQAQVKMGRHRAALRVMRRLQKYNVSDQELATRLIFKGQALAGLDSLPAAIDTYESVASSYPRSKFSAEAVYRLGVLYQEKLDSLTVAKAKFDLVPRQYSKSPYAPEAIRRSISITKLERLRASLGQGGGEDKAGVQLGLAEVQLFQLANYEEALANYQLIIDQYPDSEVAPKAVYAIAYIHGNFLKDEAKARAAYLLLMERYPDSQQAQHARHFLGLDQPGDGVIEHPDSTESARKSDEP